MRINKAAIARHFRVSKSAVSQWFKTANAVPAERCPDIERLHGGKLSCEQMRSDIRWQRVPDATWPHPKGRPCIDAATPLQTSATKARKALAAPALAAA